MVNDWLRRYDPVAWLRFRRPDLYNRAVAAGVDADDIASACMDGLRHAAKRYDPEAGASLSHFAVLPMSSLVLTAIRDHRPGGLTLGRGGRYKSPPPQRPTRLDQDDGEFVLAGVADGERGLISTPHQRG
jgi:hypothetical protein